MENTFLASLQKEGQITPSEEQEEEKETPAESPAEKEPKEDEPESQTGDEPEGEGDEKSEGEVKEGEGEGKEPEPVVFQAFHKHPRWKALNEELGTLRQFRDEVEPLLPLIKKMGEPGMIDEDTKIPQWFVTLFGDNKQAWGEYQEYDLGQRKQLRTEVLSEIQQKQESVAQATTKQEEWLDGEITKLDEVIEEEKLPKYNRNELLKIAVEFKPTDDKGNISLRKAYEIWRLQKGEKKEPPKSDEKKKIANQTMAKSKSDEERKTYKTSHDLDGKSFHDLLPE